MEIVRWMGGWGGGRIHKWMDGSKEALVRSKWM